MVALVTAALLGTLGWGLWSTRSGERPPLTVKGKGDAPLFRLENVHRGQSDVELIDYRGRPVVVNFWASWCVPCRRELPGFAAVSEELEGKVAFVGVNHQDGRASGLEFLQQTGVRYPSGFDPKGDVAASYGLLGMPTTVFVSAEGKLLERRTGEISRKELEQTIERLFRRASTS